MPHQFKINLIFKLVHVITYHTYLAKICECHFLLLYPIPVITMKKKLRH